MLRFLGCWTILLRCLAWIFTMAALSLIAIKIQTAGMDELRLPWSPAWGNILLFAAAWQAAMHFIMR